MHHFVVKEIVLLFKLKLMICSIDEESFPSAEFHPHVSSNVTFMSCDYVSNSGPFSPCLTTCGPLAEAEAFLPNDSPRNQTEARH